MNNRCCCVATEKDLRQALAYAQSGDVVKICQGKSIPITNVPIDLTKVAPYVTLSCQGDYTDCSIVARKHRVDQPVRLFVQYGTLFRRWCRPSGPVTVGRHYRVRLYR
jgi:hypothetical protein